MLGTHVKQAGSLVDPGHLRFDFSHFAGVADEELQDIEDIVNKEVLRNIKVETIEDVPIDVAVNEYKAMALFGEKYGEKVRVIKIGDFSTELCGGTHTSATGEIGLIKIMKEERLLAACAALRLSPVKAHSSISAMITSWKTLSPRWCRAAQQSGSPPKPCARSSSSEDER